MNDDVDCSVAVDLDTLDNDNLVSLSHGNFTVSIDHGRRALCGALYIRPAGYARCMYSYCSVCTR